MNGMGRKHNASTCQPGLAEK